MTILYNLLYKMIKIEMRLTCEIVNLWSHLSILAENKYDILFNMKRVRRIMTEMLGELPEVYQFSYEDKKCIPKVPSFFIYKVI